MAANSKFITIANKGMWPAPVYEAHFTDDTVRRMAFWSKAGKPVDVERGKRLCISVEPGKVFSWGIVEIDGKSYKQYRGMGSMAAMKEGSAVRYGHQLTTKTNMKVAPEGVEALKEVSGSVDRVLNELIGGLQSGLGYLGAKNLSELREKARFVRVSPAGQKESEPHDVIEVKASVS